MIGKVIIVKIGSSTIVGEHGINMDRVRSLCRSWQAARALGYRVLVVLSGAVATGGFSMPRATRQVRAARGQWLLTAAVEDVARTIGLPCALLLLTRQDFVHRERHRMLHDTLQGLFTQHCIPIVNGNDAVSLSDADDFPDNDHLSAILAISMRAEHLFLLTNVEGILSGNPNTRKDVELIPVVANVNAPLLAMAAGEHSAVGKGGMVGKLRAARLATAAGVPVHIFNGANPEYVIDILEGKKRGTLCLPRAKRSLNLSTRDRWILSAHNTGASVQIDIGAATALRKRKSLLAVGVAKIFGTFTEHEVIEIVDHDRDTVAIGCAGMSSEALRSVLAAKKGAYGVEVVHANNLILLS